MPSAINMFKILQRMATSVTCVNVILRGGLSMNHVRAAIDSQMNFAPHGEFFFAMFADFPLAFSINL